MKKNILVSLAFIFASLQVNAGTIDYDLSFSTTGQSIWGAGESYSLDESTFIGAQWSNKTASFGDILGSSSVHVPGTGGEFCVPLVGCISNPIPNSYLDTRTGLEASATTSGKVGIELGISIDSGSVDSTVSYAAAFDIPDGTTNLIAGEYYNFNTNSNLAGINTLDTTFSSLTLSADAVMELSGNVQAMGCVVFAGCLTGSDSFSVVERASILSFNADGEGGVEVVGQTPSDLGLPIPDGFPVEIDVAGLAEVTIHLPQPDVSGGLNNVTQTLTASGQDDLLDLIVDVDNVIATAAGLPGLFGQSVDTPIGEIGYDIINVEMGPTIDLQQDFELTPTLFVNMIFDQAVLIAGEWVTTLNSAWDSLPDIAFADGVTMVTPTFYVTSYLENNTLLDFDFDFSLDLLQVNYDLELYGLSLGEGSFGIGNVLSNSLNMFDSPALYSNIFSLGGFNSYTADSFSVTVPEPSSIVIFLTVLAGFLTIRRKGVLFR